MGKEIEAIAKGRGHKVVRIDPNSSEAEHKHITRESLEGIDVAIDFTHPSAVMENIRAASSHKVNVVVGTTGWYDQMSEMEDIVRKGNIGLIWSGNFSIGMNLFFEMVKSGARVMEKVPEYDVLLHEIHHAKKADSPSGTAEMIASIILGQMKRKNSIVRDRLDRPLAQNEIHLSSTRGGTIPGTHTILFDSDADTIEFTHTARNRHGFALGAILAAEWIKGKKGFHSIDDFMGSLLGK
jgi:4-hydroxy-tetrahydrodipicolinate reductase